jgi:hypothetical protein
VKTDGLSHEEGNWGLPFWFRAYPADLDGDGRAELIDPSCSILPGNLYTDDSLSCTHKVYQFNGAGFVPAPWFAQGAINGGAVGHSELLAYDANGDGLPDLVYSTGDNTITFSSSWAVRLGLPGASLGAPSTFGPPLAVSFTTPLGFHDQSGMRPFRGLNASFQEILRSDGTVLPLSAVTGNVGQRRSGVIGGNIGFMDFNGDHLPDGFDADNCSSLNCGGSVYINTGAGFDNSASFSSMGLPGAPAHAYYRQFDFNQDGLPDLLVPSMDDGQGMRVLVNHRGSFSVDATGIPRGQVATGSIGSTMAIKCRTPGTSDPYFSVPGTAAIK